MRQEVLRPVDIAVALELARESVQAYEQLAGQTVELVGGLLREEPRVANVASLVADRLERLRQMAIGQG